MNQCLPPPPDKESFALVVTRIRNVYPHPSFARPFQKISCSFDTAVALGYQPRGAGIHRDFSIAAAARQCMVAA